jgi:hypothetical protein
MADIRELGVSWGFRKQSALQTALLAANMWSLNQTNDDFGIPRLVKEDNQQDKGKGTPFATQQFKTIADAEVPWNYYLTSENLAMLGVFGIGKVSEAAVGTEGAIRYICKPNVTLAAVNDEAPSTTYLATIRQGSNDVVDHALIGVCLEEFTITIARGTNRDTAQMTSRWIGCGKYAQPSAIVRPAITVEHELNAGSVTLLEIFGDSLITNKRFEQFTLTYKNNIKGDFGYYPGSGSQNGFQLRGRMLRSAPTVTASYQALLEDTSTEFTDFLNGESGLFRVKMEGALIGAGPEKHTFDLKLPAVEINAVSNPVNDGLLFVESNLTLKDITGDTDRMLVWDVLTNKANIGEVPA